MSTFDCLHSFNLCLTSLGCPSLRGSSNRRLRRCVATSTLWTLYFWTKLFWLTVPKNFVESTFWCLWAFASACYRLYLHTLNYLARENNLEKKVDVSWSWTKEKWLQKSACSIEIKPRRKKSKRRLETFTIWFSLWSTAAIFSFL